VLDNCSSFVEEDNRSTVGGTHNSRVADRREEDNQAARTEEVVGTCKGRADVVDGAAVGLRLSLAVVHQDVDQESALPFHVAVDRPSYFQVQEGTVKALLRVGPLDAVPRRGAWEVVVSHCLQMDLHAKPSW